MNKDSGFNNFNTCLGFNWKRYYEIYINMANCQKQQIIIQLSLKSGNICLESVK